MNIKAKSLFLMGLLVGLSIPAFSAGFALYEGSARGNALGGLTGQADDPAAIFYNPAGITQLEGRQFMAGVTFIQPFADVTTLNLYDQQFDTQSYETNVFTPPHFYYTHQLTENTTFGFGVFTRFGLGVEFDDDWEGRYSSTNADIATITINPNIAWKVNDRWSVAFGLDAVWLKAELEQAIDATRFNLLPGNNPNTSEFDAHQTIEGESWGYGFNAAVHFQPNDRWSFGLTYNSKVEQDIDDGTVKFRRPRAAVPETWFVDANAAADTIDLPEMIFFGGAVQLSERTELGFGIVHTGWSSIQELVFRYDQPVVVVPGAGLALDTVSRELKWEDVMRYNIGAQTKLTEHCDIMYSFIYDESPIPDETVSYLLPSNDRQLLDIGFQYRFEKWVMEGSYAYLTLRDRRITGRQFTEGVLESEVDSGGAHLVGFSMSRKF